MVESEETGCAYGKVFGEENKNQFFVRKQLKKGSRQPLTSTGARFVCVPVPFVNVMSVIASRYFSNFKSLRASRSESDSNEKTRKLSSLMSQCMTLFACKNASLIAASGMSFCFTFSSGSARFTSIKVTDLRVLTRVIVVSDVSLEDTFEKVWQCAENALRYSNRERRFRWQQVRPADPMVMTGHGQHLANETDALFFESSTERRQNIDMLFTRAAEKSSATCSRA